MKRKWMIVGGMVTALVVLTAAAAFARAARRDGRDSFAFFGGRGLAELQVRLKLTPEQTQQIRGILKDARQRGFNQMGSGSDARAALARAVFSPEPNQAEIQKNVQALGQQHQQRLEMLVNTGQQISQVLTPEQRAEMQKIIDEKVQVAQQRRQQFRQRMQQRRDQSAPPAQP